MHLILKKPWEALNGENDDPNHKEIIPAGRHEVERIPNPFDHPNADWIVLVGTKIGGTEAYWRQFEEYDDDDEFKVVIEE